MIDPTKYVVLDVETNGLYANRYDLLSISIYKPDDGKQYDRFLPLEKNDYLFQFEINGITSDMVSDKTPLSQEEIDEIISQFELEDRTILTYGDIDERFLKHYFSSHSLKGFDKFTFFNFKRQIFSSGFSSGNITKDNLCTLFKIENVTKVHSGSNDCILEWKLFEKIGEKGLIVTENSVFKMSEEYYIPVSYICNYPHLMKKMKPLLPDIYCTYTIVFSVPCPREVLDTNETNGGGMILEHIINTRLDVIPHNNLDFILKNKSVLEYVGKLPSDENIVFMHFNDDGSVSALNSKDQREANRLNKKIKKIEKAITPMLDFLKTKVFCQHIYSQELVINETPKIMALCDLSDKQSVVEIKGYFDFQIDKIKYQLFYESNHRDCYILFFDSDKLNLAKVSFCSKEKYEKLEDTVKKEHLTEEKEKFNKGNSLKKKKLEIIEYNGKGTFGQIKCLKCKKTFRAKMERGFYYDVKCPYCNISTSFRIWDRTGCEKRYDLEKSLHLRGLEIYNWVTKDEIYVRCKRCKKIMCDKLQNLIKGSFCCDCDK